jgi:hypothetical protein
MDKYYLSLGKFVDRFASAEDSLFVSLQITMKLDSKVGAAVFSGTRVKGAMAFIKRIHEARGSEVSQRLAAAFAQLSAILALRDDILHYGVRGESDQLRITNAIRAHAERSVKDVPVSVEMLDNMSEDLNTINTVLLLYCAEFANPDLLENSKGENLDRLIAISQRPWLYKSPQPAKNPA